VTGRRSALAALAAAAVTAPLLIAAPVGAQPGPPSLPPGLDDLPSMIAVEAADFLDDAAALPPALWAAVVRDTDLTPAEYMANAAAGDVAREVVDALAETIDVRGSEMRGPELVVYVASAADAEVVEQTGATAIIGEQPELEPITTPLYPAFDLRGGEWYQYDNFRCTTGFVGTNSAGATQLLTAGHCTTGASTTRRQARFLSAPTEFGGVPMNGTDLGLPVAGSYVEGFGYDHGLIGIANPATWTPLPEVNIWGGEGAPDSNSVAVMEIRDARAPLVGEHACKSGATSGFTCGEIKSVNTWTCVGGNPFTFPNCDGGYVVNGVWADICMQSGDSGGPALVGNTAIGVNSASNAPQPPPGEGPGDCLPPGQHRGIFAPLYSSGSATSGNPYGNRSAATLYGGGWEISVKLDSVALTTPSSLNSYYTGTTIAGTLTNATPRTRVELVIDGRVVKTAAVGGGGAWSIDIADTDPGVRSFELRARWGLRSTSTVITGTWTTLLAPPQRFTGADRYAAAANISAGQFAPGVEKVFVATGDNFPDALAAGPVAAAFNAPLLLTPRFGGLPASVAAELARLDPEQIVVIGGTLSMPPALVSQMAAYASNTTTPTVRINGATRFDVSLELLRFAQDAGYFQNVSRAWVVTGNGFADALSVSAVASAETVPVVLVPGTDAALSPTVRDAIDSLNPAKISVGGGPNSVSGGIVSQLGTIAPTTRFGGADRFEASVNINRAVHPTADTVFIASGLNYPDALAGGVVAGLNNAPLLITFPQCVPVSVITEIDRLGIDYLRVLGGPNSVNPATANLTRC
jgi:putative cell wall-binding protein